MSRAVFGTWGAQLSQEAFAEAIAALGVLGPRSEPLDEQAIFEAVRTQQAAAGDIAVLRLRHLARLVGSTTGTSQHLLSPEGYRSAWATFRDRWYDQLPPATPLLRIEIDPAVEARMQSRVPDVSWLMSLLLGSHGIADAAYVRVDRPDRLVAWEWPLRIGLLGDRRSIEFGRQLSAVPWPRLVECVSLDKVDEDCDLLLLADDLRGAAARVLQEPRRLRADCVLLTGGAGVATDRILPLARALRSEVLTAGVGIARVDPEVQQHWVTALIEQLAHDAPLDVAVFRALKKAYGGEPSAMPLLMMSRRLATSARVTAFTHRLGQEVRRIARSRPKPLSHGNAPVRRLRSIAAGRSVPVALDRVADELESAARSGAFLNETGDATHIVDLRSSVEASIGTPVGTPRDGAGDPTPIMDDQRRVNFTVTDMTDAGAPVRVRDRLSADRAYDMAIDIGKLRHDVASASERFPSERLTPSHTGHWLDISFVPLVRTSSGRLHTPQRSRLWLPRTADSKPCHVTFRTHGVEVEYRARILVSHKNRVIQSLIFSAPLTDFGRGFSFDVENVVSPGFGIRAQDKPFDAAIVVNHDNAGQAGYTALVGQAVSFREPVGVGDLVEEVKKLLSAEATFPESRGTLDDPALLKLFDDLATYGRSILKPLPPELLDGLPDGARIQVVEARSGAWLPVEIFYDARPPRPGATLCPNARAALLGEAGASHAACEHRDDRDHHCPLRFWGLSRVIERQPALKPIPGADYTISVPRSGADRLDAFRSALIGASKKVRVQDLDQPGGIVEAVQRVARAARRVTDWNEWEDAIEKDSPSLLVLLPHSLEDPAHPKVSALEIGGLLLTYADLDTCYVSGPAAQPPVVLLLGCSTQLTDVPFLNFVEGFKRENAALVIGTLATIRGRRATAFVSGLLDALKAAAGSERTFGDVFLEARRRLLAGGDGFALSLTAYGDVGWRI
jgi:hypothetical protein